MNEDTVEGNTNNQNINMTTTTYSSEADEDDTDNRLKYLEESVARLSKENIWLKEKISTKVEEVYDVWGPLYHCKINTSNLNQYNPRENIEVACIPNNIHNHHLEDYIVHKYF